jgi:hypothetical protein
MGFVSGFIDELVTPLETAAGQIRQLSKEHTDGNTYLQSQAQGLTKTFGGKGANAFFTMAHRQGQFIGGITAELDQTAGIFDKTAQIIRDAAQVADWALGGPLMDLAEKVLEKLSPHIVVEHGESAITAIASDMRQNFHQLLHHSSSVFGDLVHGHFSAAWHDTENALGDLAHLGEDLFALLDQVETILGHWAGKVMEGANWLTNQFQSILFKMEDFIFGFSKIADDSAILSDPNATDKEKALAIADMSITILSDALFIIPGAEEGGVALDAIEKTVGEEIENEIEQQVEKEVEGEIEQQIEKRLEDEGSGGDPPNDDGNNSGNSNFDENNPPATKESVTKKLNDYLLNPDHPIGGPKAKWFRTALGFTRDNIGDLAKQILFDPAKAVETDVTEFGTKYNQVISIVGANGRTIDVVFAWIRNNDGIVRLVTAIPPK